MKKSNFKQIAWSQRKVSKDLARRRRQFVTILMVLAIGIFGGMALADDSITFNDVKNPIAVATIMGAVGSIDKATSVDKRGNKIRAKVWILSADQWDDTQAFPARAGREVGDIPLKAGEYWHYAEMVTDSTEYKAVGESGDVAGNITSTLTMILGGMGDKVLDLLETGLSEDFFVVVQFCHTGEKFIIGDGCKPVMLKSFDGGSTKDNTSWTVVFERATGLIWSTYVGNTAEEAPAVVAADAVTFALTSNARYQLTDGSAAVVTLTGLTAVADADVGRTFTILGSGGTYPTKITDANDFLLIDGTQWDALANTQISFQIFKDGAGSYKFIEVAGTRT